MNKVDCYKNNIKKLIINIALFIHFFTAQLQSKTSFDLKKLLHKAPFNLNSKNIAILAIGTTAVAELGLILWLYSNKKNLQQQNKQRDKTIQNLQEQNQKIPGLEKINEEYEKYKQKIQDLELKKKQIEEKNLALEKDLMWLQTKTIECEQKLTKFELTENKLKKALEEKNTVILEFTRAKQKFENKFQIQATEIESNNNAFAQKCQELNMSQEELLKLRQKLENLEAQKNQIGIFANKELEKHNLKIRDYINKLSEFDQAKAYAQSQMLLDFIPEYRLNIKEEFAQINPYNSNSNNELVPLQNNEMQISTISKITKQKQLFDENSLEISKRFESCSTKCNLLDQEAKLLQKQYENKNSEHNRIRLLEKQLALLFRINETCVLSVASKDQEIEKLQQVIYRYKYDTLSLQQENIAHKAIKQNHLPSFQQSNTQYKAINYPYQHQNYPQNQIIYFYP